ncbi:hypothetical protein GGI05_000754 [Coemansia sp. RSA 2603]|nr:hypothetical protein GGI05_000754 [Coemansia sp. RSA 2603]
MNIDDIFTERVGGIAAGGGGRGKRKLAAAPSLSELRQHGYALNEDSEETAPAAKRPHTSAAPDSDGESDGDSEGGRFFSSGLTQHEKQVLAWVDQGDDAADGEDTVEGGGKLLARVQRAVERNTKQRVRHADAPLKFADSEADLDAALRALLPLAGASEGCAQLAGHAELLVGLLAHANADIAGDVVELVHEASVDSDADAWVLVDALAQADFFDALGANLRRLDGASEYSADDDATVARTLDIVGALASQQPARAPEYLRSMRLPEWLLESLGARSEARQLLAAEALADLLPATPHVHTLFLEAQAPWRLLARMLAPAAAEVLENCADALCALLLTARGKQAFAPVAGRLAQMCPGDAHMRMLACKILAHALAPADVAAEEEENAVDARRESALAFVREGGVKLLGYAVLRRGVTRGLLREHPAADERAVSCLALTLRLTHGAPAHWRVLAKFLPSAAAPQDAAWKRHVDRLVELDVLYAERVAAQQDEHEEVVEEETRVAAVHALHMANVALGFVALAGDATRERIERLLRRRARSLDHVARELHGSADAAVTAADLERLLLQQ